MPGKYSMKENRCKGIDCEYYFNEWPYGKTCRLYGKFIADIERCLKNEKE
jgi:hypothetical protein